MPNRQHFDSSRSGSNAIVQMIMDAREMNSPHTGKVHIQGTRADGWLRGNELESEFQVVDECGWCFGPIGRPPLRCVCDCTRRAANYTDQELIAQEFRSC